VKNKTIIRHNLIPVRMAIIRKKKKKNLQTVNPGESIEKREPS